MKKIIITLTITTVSFFLACKSTKPAVAVTTSPTGSSAVSTNGIMIPTNEQVLAVQSKYPNVKLEELNEGYKIYTGVCTHCHGTKNIYNRDEMHWVNIIEDMAPKSHLTEVQTDQLTKYIMSIKASQPKSSR